MARPPASPGGGGGQVLYYEIADFKQGMDLRKSALTAPAGTMRLLENADITPGGEIEKRAAFQPWAQCPSGSVGLCAVNNQVYTHLPSGSGITPPTATSVGVIHITPQAGVTLVSQLSYDVFNGEIYAVLQGSNGGVYHYYNGVQVTNYPSGVGWPTFIRTYKEKVYGLTGRWLYFSAVGDPTTWQDPPPDGSGNVAHNGSGFINIGANDADSENLISMEVYYDKMAIFSSLSTQLWFLDPDPSLNQYYQTLRDAGTLAALSVRQYVANDVYFFGTHGIRSLRARDLSLTAAVADVGSPLDPLLQDLIATQGPSWISQIVALLSPRTGRIWMICPDRIYILSNFASPNISAWSVYIPEFTISGAAYADPYVVLRDTTGMTYRFGSTGPIVYDSCPVTVLLPWLSFDKPTTFKFYQGYDQIATNTWNVQAAFDPTTDPNPVYDQICTATGPTILGGRIPMQARSTHLQLQLTCQAPGPATLSKIILHYAQSDTD